MAPFVSNSESFSLDYFTETPSLKSINNNSNNELAAEAIFNLQTFIQENKTFQLSSFGPTGMVILDLLSKAGLLSSIPVVFIDTLHHFEETYRLVDRVVQTYPEIDLRIYKPKGCETREDFERKYGPQLWDRMPTKYAYYTKVEPRDRAIEELGARSYINGRRKSQGNKRGDLSFLDHDTEMDITRVQPLFSWGFEQVWNYIHLNAVPYNELHDKGYKSVGDFMSTSVTGEGEDERAGRWKGKNQTECGLHLSTSELATLIGQAWI